MKRMPVYLAIMAAVLAVPVKSNDVGKLRPVQAITFYMENGAYVLETDTGDKGKGSTPLRALENLKDTTPAVIYLDTAEFFLLADETEAAIESLRPKLKKTVRLCKIEGRVNPKKAAEYLRVHKNLPWLKNWKSPDKLPILEQYQGRMKIIPNYENNA